MKRPELSRLCFLSILLAIQPVPYVRGASFEGEVLVQIDGYGLAGITYRDLEAALGPSLLDTDRIGLFLKEEAVPILVLDGEDGRFDPGDRILFFSPACPDRYSVTNVFRLLGDTDRPCRMTRPSPPEEDLPEIRFDRMDGIYQQSRYKSTCNAEKKEHHLPFSAHKYRELRVEVTLDPPMLPPESVEVKTLKRTRRVRMGEEGKAVFLCNGGLDGTEGWSIPVTLGLPEGVQKYTLEAVGIRERDNGFAINLQMKDGAGIIRMPGFPRGRYFAYRLEDRRLLWTRKGGEGKDVPLEIRLDPGDNTIFLSSEEGLLEPSRIRRRMESSLAKERIHAAYLAIAPASFLDVLQPHMDYRRRDLGSAMAVALEEVYQAFSQCQPEGEAVRDFVRRAAEESDPPLRYLLLVGRARERFSVGYENPYVVTSERFDSTVLLPPLTYACQEKNHTLYVTVDSLYGDLDQDGIPELGVGRIPAETPEELEAVLEKIRAYEQSNAFAPSCRRLFLQAGLGRYDTSGANKTLGAMLEGMLEQWARMLLDQWVPYDFDVEAIYSAAASNHFHAPSSFRDQVVRELEKGFFAAFYIGHGSTTSYDGFEWRGRRYSTFLAEDSRRVAGPAVKGPYFGLTCSSGTFALVGEDRCLAEELFVNPKGPVAVVASSRAVEDTANFLTVVSALKALFHDRIPRMGDLLGAVKREMSLQLDNPDMAALLGLLGMVTGSDFTMEEQILLARNQYNLFGDPALRIRYPGEGIILEVESPLAAGQAASIRGSTERITEGKAWLTVELPRDRHLGTIRKRFKDMSIEEAETLMRKNYALANQRVIASAEVPVKEGAFTGTLDLPAGLPAGTVHIKAYVAGEGTDAAGHLEARIQ